jgi:hypothetical protein
MAAQNIASASINNLSGNATGTTEGVSLLPGVVVANNAGAGAPGYLKHISDIIAVTTAGLASTSSTYKMIRLKSNVILKSLDMTPSATLDSGGGSATLTWDVGAYYSDSTFDGTPSADQGNSISANCFAAVVVSPLVGVKTNVFGPTSTDAGVIIPAFNEQLWQQVGLTADPGGYIDIVLAVHAAADVAVAGTIAISATFV